MSKGDRKSYSLMSISNYKGTLSKSLTGHPMNHCKEFNISFRDNLDRRFRVSRVKSQVCEFDGLRPYKTFR